MECCDRIKLGSLSLTQRPVCTPQENIKKIESELQEQELQCES